MSKQDYYETLGVAKDVDAKDDSGGYLVVCSGGEADQEYAGGGFLVAPALRHLRAKQEPCRRRRTPSGRSATRGENRRREAVNLAVAARLGNIELVEYLTQLGNAAARTEAEKVQQGFLPFVGKNLVLWQRFEIPERSAPSEPGVEPAAPTDAPS